MKKSKRHKSIERYIDMEIPFYFVDEVFEMKGIFENCDRTTLERECTRMFAYSKMLEVHIDSLDNKENHAL